MRLSRGLFAFSDQPRLAAPGGAPFSRSGTSMSALRSVRGGFRGLPVRGRGGRVVREWAQGSLGEDAGALRAELTLVAKAAR